MSKPFTPLRRALAAAAVLALAASGAQAVEAWSMPGSTGIVDDGSTKLLTQSGQTVSFKSGKTGTAVVRFPVLDVFPDAANPTPKWLGLGFVDDGIDGRVTAQLYQQNISTGAITLIGPFWDSNTATPAATYQFMWKNNCAMALDFFNNTYWVEATLARTTTAGNPSVQQVRMDNFACAAAAVEGTAERH